MGFGPGKSFRFSAWSFFYVCYRHVWRDVPRKSGAEEAHSPVACAVQGCAPERPHLITLWFYWLISGAMARFRA